MSKEYPEEPKAKQAREVIEMSWDAGDFEQERAEAVERITLKMDRILRERAARRRRGAGPDWAERAAGDLDDAAEAALAAPW